VAAPAAAPVPAEVEQEASKATTAAAAGKINNRFIFILLKRFWDVICSSAPEEGYAGHSLFAKLTESRYSLLLMLKDSAQHSAREEEAQVWVPAQTGSHIGRNWVEVDDDAEAPQPSPGVSKVLTLGSDAARSIQNNSDTIRPQGGG
jgi:hypothetical protein